MARNRTREDFVRRLLAFEGRTAKTRDERANAAAALFEKTFGVLAPVIGGDAVDAIFKRTVRLTKRDFPCVAVIVASGARVDPRVCLRDCWKEEDAPDAAIALYTRFFTSIDVLIGERLASRMIQTAWPDLPESDFRTETEEEKG